MFPNTQGRIGFRFSSSYTVTAVTHGKPCGFSRHRKTIASQYITVFPQGYRESWNIVAERSKADDCEFIEAIVGKLTKADNVDPKNFTIMGSSNGSALVNQLMIESDLSHVRNYIKRRQSS